MSNYLSRRRRGDDDDNSEGLENRLKCIEKTQREILEHFDQIETMLEDLFTTTDNTEGKITNMTLDLTAVKATLDEALKDEEAATKLLGELSTKITQLENAVHGNPKLEGEVSDLAALLTGANTELEQAEQAATPPPEPEPTPAPAPPPAPEGETDEEKAQKAKEEEEAAQQQQPPAV